MKPSGTVTEEYESNHGLIHWFIVRYKSIHFMTITWQFQFAANLEKKNEIENKN
jgi:hypothetical protein